MPVKRYQKLRGRYVFVAILRLIDVVGNTPDSSMGWHRKVWPYGPVREAPGQHGQSRKFHHSPPAELSEARARPLWHDRASLLSGTQMTMSETVSLPC
jgi:hypothetical protein